MHDVAAGVTTPGHHVVQGVHRKARPDPVAGAVSDDPAKEGVLLRAEVEFALVRLVLGDILEPELADVISVEILLHLVVVYRRARALAVRSSLAAECRPPLVVSACPPFRYAVRSSMRW